MSETIPETIQDRVLRVIATTKRIPLETVRPESTFEELGVDSLDRLNILFDLESEFDVEINDEDAKKVSNIDEMVSGITLLLNAKQSTGSPSSPPAQTAIQTAIPPASPGRSPAAVAHPAHVEPAPSAEDDAPGDVKA
jgi:acyl carrier protein